MWQTSRRRTSKSTAISRRTRPGPCRSPIARAYRETIRPAGAICSSANDMAKFAIFQLGEGEFRGRRLLRAETIAGMQELHGVAPLPPIPDPQLTYPKFLFGAGLGWHIRDYRRHSWCEHAGSTGTLIGLVPEEKLGVVVLTNLGGGIQTVMMHDAIDRVLGFDRTWTNREFIDATNGPRIGSARGDRTPRPRARQT